MPKSVPPKNEVPGKGREVGSVRDEQPPLMLSALREHTTRQRHRDRPIWFGPMDVSIELADPSRDAMETVLAYVQRCRERDEHRAKGTPIPPELSEANDPCAPLRFCRFAIELAALDKQAVDKRTGGPSQIITLGDQRVDLAELLVGQAGGLLESAERWLAEGNPEWAVAAAFEAGVVLMVFQREAYRNVASDISPPPRPRKRPERTRSPFSTTEIREIGRSLAVAVDEYMNGPERATENDARGRAYRKIGETLMKKHGISEPPAKANLRRYLKAWYKESGQARPQRRGG